MGLVDSVLNYPGFGNTQQVLIQSSDKTIAFDCNVKEHHKRSAKPTKFEVENGQSITDHLILEPPILTLQVIVTDTPFSLFQGVVASAVAYAAPSAASLGKYAPALALAGAVDFTSRPSITKYQDLVGIYKSRLPVQVFTTLDKTSYKNMWITSLGVPRDNKTGRCVIFDIELEQLLLVQTRTVNLQILKDADNGAGKNDKGSQQSNKYVKNFNDHATSVISLGK